MSDFDSPQAPVGRAQFLTTRWSVVLGAGNSRGPEDQERALEKLCCDYWYPLYAYLRRSGKSQTDAEDLTQGFFERFLVRQDIKKVTPEGGRFRSYLLKALKNHVANEWAKENTAKRGGGVNRISLDEDCEGRYEREPSDSHTPESLYNKSWASSILEKVLTKLESEFARSGKAPLFNSLRGHLGGSGGDATQYREIGEMYEMSVGAVTMTARRMRQRYGELLRREIAETVTTPEEVEQEIMFLMSALAA